MCQGYNRTHTECGHIKYFTIIFLCHAANPYDERCDGPREVLFTQDIDFPGLCRPCYIAQEVFIFDLYAGEIADLKAGMANIRNILRLRRDGEDDRTRRGLEVKLAHLQEGLDDSIADRTGMLAKFRRSQGVWGDG